MSDTITAFYEFTAGTKARSAQVNANFSNFRGDLIPIDPNTATGSHLTYDLGSTEYRWLDAYLRGFNLIGMTTTANLTLQRNNTATTGAFDLGIGGSTIASFKLDHTLFSALSRTTALTSGVAPIGGLSSGSGNTSSGYNLDTSASKDIITVRATNRSGAMMMVAVAAEALALVGLTTTAWFISSRIDLLRGATTTALSTIKQCTTQMIAATTTTRFIDTYFPFNFTIVDTSAPAGELVYVLRHAGGITNFAGNNANLSLVNMFVFER